MNAQCQFRRSNRIYWSHYFLKKNIHKIDFRWPVFASRKLKHAYRPSHFPLEFFCKQALFPLYFARIWSSVSETYSLMKNPRFHLKCSLIYGKYHSNTVFCFVLWNKTFFRDTYVKRQHIFGAKFEPPLGFIPSSNKIQV